MARAPTKNDNDTLPKSSSAYIKSSTLRKKVAKMASKKSKTAPPKSKVKMQSEKPISRKAGKLSYEGAR